MYYFMFKWLYIHIIWLSINSIIYQLRYQNENSRPYKDAHYVVNDTSFTTIYFNIFKVQISILQYFLSSLIILKSIKFLRLDKGNGNRKTINTILCKTKVGTCTFYYFPIHVCQVEFAYQEGRGMITKLYQIYVTGWLQFIFL